MLGVTNLQVHSSVSDITDNINKFEIEREGYQKNPEIFTKIKTIPNTEE